MSSGHSDGDATKPVTVISSGLAFGRYRILQKIGSGGMGEVYLAEDTTLDRRVALKFLSPQLLSSRDCVTRFQREAHAAAKLSHPNIVTIHEVGEFAGRPFIAMEFVEGKTLRELLDAGGLPVEQTIQIGAQICDGLQKAHQEGVIHRDIKPGNVLIDTDGRPRICDFGLAAIAGCEPLTKADSAIGTISYMSPEQIRGEEPDCRSDLFSLGIVLYEMIAGKHPFKAGNDAATLRNITDSQPESLCGSVPEVSAEVEVIVSRALKKEKSERYQSAGELATDLRSRTAISRAQPSPKSSARRETTPTASAKWALLVVALIVLALAAILVRSDSKIWNRVKGSLGIDVVPESKHLAVLPFVNVGDAIENQAFCDGLLETMTSKLSQLEQFHGSLWVVPAVEVRQREIAGVLQARRAFNVTLAITGSVQRIGDEVRMTLNLVDAMTDRQLRSKLVDGTLQNVSAIQDSAVLRCVEMLELESQPGQERFLLAGGTTSGVAYDLYLQGRGFLQRYEVSGAIDTAIALFERALAEDSMYASAYAGLGKALWRKYEASKQPVFVGTARDNCAKALALDDHLVEAHLTMGQIRFSAGSYPEAIAEFQHALRLDTTCYDAYRDLARANMRMNEPDKAEAFLKKAIATKPDRWIGYQDLGMFYMTYGRYSEAEEPVNKVVQLLPEDYRGWSDLGVLYLDLNRTHEASRAWHHSIELEPNDAALSNLGSLYFLDGQYPDAVQMFRKALQIDSTNYQLWGNLAMAEYWTPELRDSSKSIFKRAIQMAELQRAISPRDPALLCDLAGSYVLAGEGFKGQPIIQEALKQAPDNIDVIVNAGLFYLRLGKRDSGLVFIKSALSRGYPLEQVLKLPEIRETETDSGFRAALLSREPRMTDR